MTRELFFEVWDDRECVSRHSTALGAHRDTIRSGDHRTLTLFDREGRVIAMYRHGRELLDDVNDSAFGPFGVYGGAR